MFEEHSAKYLEGRTERHSFTGSIANLKHINIHVLELRAGGQSQEQSLCSYSHLSEEPLLGTQATAGNKIFEMNLQVIVCAFEHVFLNLQLVAASRQNLQASDVISDVIINESFQDKIKAWRHKTKLEYIRECLSSTHRCTQDHKGSAIRSIRDHKPRGCSAGRFPTGSRR